MPASEQFGPVLQICYAPALREKTARRNFFANALALARATRGKGIIISSGARSALELRGPYDVINMATLFGLSEQDATVTLLRCLNTTHICMSYGRATRYRDDYMDDVA